MNHTLTTPSATQSKRVSGWLLALLLVAFTVAIVFTVKHLRSVQAPLGVAVMTWGGAGPGFVAAEKGFFGDLKVELKILNDTKARQAAYLNDDIEIYLTNPDQHPREVKLGLPGNMFMLSDFSAGADGVVSRSTISKVADLRGKRIAFTQGTASDFMLAKALSQAGLTRQQVRLVEFDDPSTGIAALNSGDVDAAVSWEPLMTQATASGTYRVLFSSRDVPRTIIGVFIGKNSFLNDEQRFRTFFDGWQRGVDFIRANPSESAKIMAKAFGVTEQEISGMMDGLELADLKANLEYFAPDSSGSTKIDVFTNDAADYWRSIGLLSEGRSSRPWTSTGVRDFYRLIGRP